MNGNATVKEFIQDVADDKYAISDMFSKTEEVTKHFQTRHVARLKKDVEKALEEEKRKSEKREKHLRELLNVLEENATEPPADKVSLPQIALINIYEGKIISETNQDEIAKSYGYTSGDRLYNCYTKYSSHEKRTQGASEKKKFDNKIKLIESVIPLLEHNKEAQRQAQKEIAEMKKKKQEYE